MAKVFNLNYWSTEPESENSIMEVLCTLDSGSVALPFINRWKRLSWLHGINQLQHLLCPKDWTIYAGSRRTFAPVSTPTTKFYGDQSSPFQRESCLLFFPHGEGEKTDGLFREEEIFLRSMGLSVKLLGCFSPLAITSKRRMGKLHALCCDSPFIKFHRGKVVLKPSLDFLPKVVFLSSGSRY